jgi:hypothetical protein
MKKKRADVERWAGREGFEAGDPYDKCKGNLHTPDDMMNWKPAYTRILFPFHTRAGVGKQTEGSRDTGEKGWPIIGTNRKRAQSSREPG